MNNRVIIKKSKPRGLLQEIKRVSFTQCISSVYDGSVTPTMAGIKGGTILELPTECLATNQYSGCEVQNDQELRNNGPGTANHNTKMHNKHQ